MVSLFFDVQGEKLSSDRPIVYANDGGAEVELPARQHRCNIIQWSCSCCC